MIARRIQRGFVGDLPILQLISLSRNRRVVGIDDFQTGWLQMRNLDLSAVQAFVLTAELQSFTRGAEVLNTTQAAINTKLKRLENHLGRQLLERTPRAVRLSAAGRLFSTRPEIFLRPSNV